MLTFHVFDGGSDVGDGSLISNLVPVIVGDTDSPVPQSAVVVEIGVVDEEAVLVDGTGEDPESAEDFHPYDRRAVGSIVVDHNPQPVELGVMVVCKRCGHGGGGGGGGGGG